MEHALAFPWYNHWKSILRGNKSVLKTSPLVTESWHHNAQLSYSYRPHQLFSIGPVSNYASLWKQNQSNIFTLIIPYTGFLTFVGLTGFYFHEMLSFAFCQILYNNNRWKGFSTFNNEYNVPRSTMRNVTKSLCRSVNPHDSAQLDWPLC